MTNDIPAQVRALKESGVLDLIIRQPPAPEMAILARFALMILEQPAAASVSGDGFDLTWHNLTPEPRGAKLFTLPPVPAPDDVEARAERAAAQITRLFQRVEKGTLYECHATEQAADIITAAIKGEM